MKLSKIGNNFLLNSSRHSKDGTTDVSKAVARKSILMQITAKAKVANGFL
jgi:hypothetical protein